MRTTVVAMALAIALAASGQVKSPPDPVKVPDAATAVSIAEKALARIYGRKKIESERPFKATLSDGIWHVGGTLNCTDVKDNVAIAAPCVGGVAMADVRQSDGRVLRTGHTK